MFDKIFTKQLGDYINNNHKSDFYLYENFSETNRIFSINSHIDNGIWLDFFSYQMNRKEFLIILEKEKLDYNNKTDGDVLKQFTMLYDGLKKEFGRASRIKKLLKEI